MKYPFRGYMSFYQFDMPPISPADVLKRCAWDIETYNAPYLVGQAEKPSYGLLELTAEQVFGGATVAEMPKTWSEADKMKVVGDISHQLGAGSDFIMACTSDFKQAGELAAKMGYRPARAGEFLQLLLWLEYTREQCFGWFLCYEGRKPGYATMAEYNGNRKPALLRVIFDNYIGNDIEEGYVNANMETYGFFVREG